jgi:type I restriction enzyme, S subunit
VKSRAQDAWPDVPLHQLFTVRRGATPRNDPSNWDGPHVWLTPEDLSAYDGKRLAASRRTLTERGLASCSAVLCPPGSLVLSSRAPIGYVVETECWTATNQGCMTLVPRRQLDSRYFRYHLLASRPSLEALGQGATFVELGSDSLRQLRLVAPPVEVQQRVADFLDRETARIDATIRARHQLAERLSERFRSLAATQLLRRVDPTTVWTDELPQGWRLARLASVIRLQRGHDLPDQARRNGPVPIISSGGFSGYHDAPRAMGPGVVTGRYGTVGEVFWVEGPYWPLNTSLYVADFRGHDQRWVYHLLRVIPLSMDAEKSAVSGINRNVVGQLYVPVPPVYEQTRLAAMLDSAEEKMADIRAAISQHIDLLREHRQTLVTASVTRQIGQHRGGLTATRS